MEKRSAYNIVCSKCSKPAIEGSDPPLCEDCNKLRKQGAQEEPSIRDVSSLFTKEEIKEK